MVLGRVPAWLIVTSSMLVGTPTEDQLTVSLQLSVSASRVHVLVACSLPTSPVRVTRQGCRHQRSGGGSAPPGGTQQLRTRPAAERTRPTGNRVRVRTGWSCPPRLSGQPPFGAASPSPNPAAPSAPADT